VETVKQRRPDYILMPGDIFERLDGSDPEAKQAGFELMQECAKIAPTFYSVGNHENGGVSSWNVIKWMRIECIPKYFDPNELDEIWDTGATFLDDGFVIEDGIAFGGLSSGLINKGRQPQLDWLDEFCSLDCPKVLLCHHPEYYEPYVKNLPIELTLSGHAHGGQWRFFGRGVYAPGQGIFPRLTHGFHDDGRLLIGRGMTNACQYPRWGNPCEMILLHLMPGKEYSYESRA
jgi:predicted MPP superfamily phosphohydrolase